MFSVFIGSLAGCNVIDARKGLDPQISYASVENSTTRINYIIDALARDTYPRDAKTWDYNLITEAGFNYIDDQCAAYFDNLFFLDRGRSQLKSGLAQTGATTAAILGATHASALSLSVVAAAFGFAASATDILAGTYLYALPPATTKGLVNSLQATYRQQSETLNIQTPTAAYHQIQGYLDLCLPPTIEAQVTNLVNQATPTATKKGKTIVVDAAGGN